MLSTLFIELRSHARRAGLTKIAWKASHKLRALVGMGNAPPEGRFYQAVLAAVRPGDVVWDVGANIGMYTLPLAQAVGTTGKVIAFEPVPSVVSKLRENTVNLANVSVLDLALSNAQGTTPISLSDPLSPTGSLHVRPGEHSVDVRMASGDALDLPPPNLVKIDVEGFEEEVLQGLSRTLARCRAVFIEVHFGLLDERGQRHAPTRIVELLRSAGFTTRWLDPSHLAGERR